MLHGVAKKTKKQTDKKIISKWIIDLNIKCKTIKFLEDTIGENLDDLGYGSNFLDTKAWEGRGILKFCVLSAQFCYDPRIALKNTVYLKGEKILESLLMVSI